MSKLNKYEAVAARAVSTRGVDHIGSTQAALDLALALAPKARSSCSARCRPRRARSMLRARLQGVVAQRFAFLVDIGLRYKASCQPPRATRSEEPALERDV